MLFFSALAFTILENAMSVIFFHRVKIKRRHFLVSAVMPYLFILFLGVGLLIVTVLSGVLQFVGTRSIVILGQPHSLDQFPFFSSISLELSVRSVDQGGGRVQG
jgi:membrane protein